MKSAEFKYWVHFAMPLFNQLKVQTDPLTFKAPVQINLSWP